jgi:YD repeat-containing protein
MGNVALAQDYASFADQYGKLVSQASDVKSLDERMFGDEESLYTGTLSFSATDVSLPGIGSFSMALTRSLRVDDPGDSGMWALGQFGDWDLELPRLSGTFAKTGTGQSGWAMHDSPLRCGGSTSSYFSQPPVARGGGGLGYFDASEYWAGNHFSLPGGGSQEMMLVSAANPNKPTDGVDYRWTTNNNWFFSCLSSTANGYAGDAFLARGPDGQQIWFDYLAKRPASAMTKYLGGAVDRSFAPANKSGSAAHGSVSPTVYAGPQAYYLEREINELLPTKIQDRFGNTLVFTYDAQVKGRLLSIVASDDRSLTLAYNSNGLIKSVTDGSRVWQYGYIQSSDGTGFSLSSVTLPDGSQWKYNLMALARFRLHASRSQPDSCTNMPPLATGTATGTVTHPSGALGTFVVAGVRNGRSKVTKVCVQDGITNGPPYIQHAKYPMLFDTISLVTKQISGPGMAGTATWSYDYGTPNGSWAESCSAPCVTTKTVLVHMPQGRYQRMVFGNEFRTDEGRIYSIETGRVVAGSPETLVPLKSEQFTFVTDATGQPFPSELGLVNFVRGDWMAARLNPQRSHVLVQDGVTFTSTTNTFDKFASPVSVTRASAGGSGGSFSRRETTSYYHDTAKWVIGQVASVIDEATAKVMSKTIFDSAKALPSTVSKFGALQQTFNYNDDGTLAEVKDGRNNVITLSSWYRGVPTTISYPTGESESAVVNSIGALTKSIDELGFSHNYGYDAIGRLKSITYPTSDTVTWNGTSSPFTKVATTELGIASPHWKRVVSTGNGRATTFYDAQWRPVLVLTEDTGNAASRSFVVTRYDTAGRKIFVGYPVPTLSSVNDGTLKGISYSYDALDRITQTQQDSELGPLTTTTEYLSGFKTRVTNPLGIKTETSYQVFDQPSTDAPVSIINAAGELEQQTTTIVRDGFGKPLSITRSGMGG